MATALIYSFNAQILAGKTILIVFRDCNSDFLKPYFFIFFHNIYQIKNFENIYKTDKPIFKLILGKATNISHILLYYSHCTLYAHYTVSDSIWYWLNYSN